MTRTLLFLALTALSTATFAQDGRDIDKVNGHITAEAGQSYGDLSTVNGGIEAADDVATRGVEAVNGSIRFGRNARIDGDVETVNGGIYIDRGSQVAGGVSTVNGAIGLVDADVERGIETVNGDVTVGVGSHVKGGIKVEKPTGNFGIRIGKQKIPRIVIGPDAVVDGPLVFEREVVLYVHASARTGAITGATAIRYDGATPPAN